MQGFLKEVIQKHTTSPIVNRAIKSNNILQAGLKDAAVVVSNDLTTTVQNLRISCQFHNYFLNIFRETMDISITGLQRRVGSHGMRKLTLLLHQHIETLDISANEVCHISLEFPASEFISGGECPRILDCKKSGKSYVNKSTLRVIQRVLAKDRFYSTMGSR